ncbi:hypothetical protein ACLMJK_007621 [Lecanora helva]
MGAPNVNLEGSRTTISPSASGTLPPLSTIHSLGPSQASGIGFDELELLHHYTTATSVSLADGHRNIGAYRVIMPQLGLEHTFLMHGILALAALHMAHLLPNRQAELVAKAAMHEGHALPAYRNAISSLTKENAHAMFAFSGLVVPYAQATATVSVSSNSSAPSTEDIFPAWFQLLRGASSLIFRTRPWLVEGPFSHLIRSQSPVDCTLNPCDERITTLFSLLSPSGGMTADKEAELLVSRTALEQLRQCSALPFSPYHTIGSKAAATIWLMIVSEEYVQLIRASNPEALIVLAHYCVLLRQTESSWHMQHQAEGLLEAIFQHIDSARSTWLEWPKEHVIARV